MTQTDPSLSKRLWQCGTFKPVIVVIFSCCLFAGQSAARTDLDREQAESRLQQLQVEIRQLQDQLEDSRSEQKNEQSRLRDLDLQIQEVNLEYRALESQRRAHREELARLELQRDDYLTSLEQHHEQLAEQIRAAYRLGRQSRLKLVLNQDGPAKLSRLLAYYDYINRAQVEQISDLRKALNTLDAMQQSIDAELLQVEEVQREQRTLLEQLDGQRQERQLLLAELTSQISSEEARLLELQRNRQDLETLINRLTDVLADIPADLGQHLDVASRRGRLPMPIDGPVIHAFGQPRAGGMRWQGWLIEAATGTEAIAVAYGRVAFADWLRGYGLLLIIDHGEGFMSLYGHNESLLHEVGDWVEPGEAISVVGAGASNNQGLYFELRKNSKAIDPAAWLAR